MEIEKNMENDWVPLFRDEGLGILHLFMEKEMEKQVDTMASWDNIGVKNLKLKNPDARLLHLPQEGVVGRVGLL